ncbi:hypothetical protein L0F63_007045, partial [Massospora cicadina]
RRECSPIMVSLSTELKVLLCVLTTIVVVGFAMFAAVKIYLRRKTNPECENLEFFLTARDTQPLMRVAWSFVAGMMGSWILTAPAANAADAGWVGMVSYAVFAGLPILAIALVGDKVQKSMPNVLSFGDYIRYRFGTIPQLYVVLVVVFNLGIALAAEYSSVNSIFISILKTDKFPIVPIIFVSTTIYTAFGGLLISIMTDVYQGIVGVSLVCVIVGAVAATFRAELGDLPTELGATTKGYNSLFILPVTLMAATVFSEAPWQRVWASESPQALKRGALLASIVLTLVVFAFGILGFFAAWSGLKSDDPNELLMLMVSSSHSWWMSIIVAILAAVICEAAIDTLQTALVSAISTMVLRDRPLKWARLLVLIINIPPIIISYKNISTYALFTLGNKITCTAAIPMLMGLYHPAKPYITGPCVLFSSILSFLSMVAFGWIYAGDFNAGVKWVAFDAYDPFSILVAILSSIVGMVLWCASAILLQQLGVAQSEIPGFRPYYLDADRLLKSDAP